MSLHLPKISIITPSFNQANFIEQSITSVLNQGYPDLEYIVMDGGSTDRTLDVLRKYGDRINWFSEPDRGQSHAINKGLRLATGDVVAYLNSDDLYEHGALLKVGRFFALHPQASWLTGRCRIVDQDGNEIRKAITFYKNFWLQLKSYRILLILDYISQPATFWRKQVIENVGYFDESLYYTLDYDYSLRVGKLYKLWVINDYLSSFRIHPASKTTLSTKAQFDSDLERAKIHTSSSLLYQLHKFHNKLIVKVYSTLIENNRILDIQSGE